MESQKRKSVKIADDETDSVESQPEQPKQEQPKQERPKQERPKNAPPDKKKSDDSTASLPPYISINEPVSDIAVPTPRAQPQKQQSTLKHQQPEIMNARDRTMSIVRRNKRRRRQERFGPLMLPEKDRTAEDIRRENLLKNKAWQLTADALRDEKEAYIIFSLRDFIIYLLFLNLLLTVSYGPKENAYNYYGSVMSDLITKSKFTTEIETGNPGSTVNQTFEGVRSIKQLWDFINKIFVTVVYMDPVRNRILMESYFIGMPSIRQVKVKKDTCITAPMFQDLYKTCYNDYSTEIEDKEPFGDPNSYPWKYQSPFPYERANGLKTTYQEGGYIFNFTLDRNFTSEWLAELETKNWIGPGTRAVVIDFATYTPNTNLFLIVKMLAEVLPEGGIKTSHQFMTIKFMRYLGPFDYFVLTCEIMFFVFTVYFTMEETQQIFLLRRKYLSNWWNILDLTIIFLSYALTFTSIRRYQLTISSLGEKLLQVDTSNHASFDDILFINETFILIDSFLTFMVWMKLFKFATLFRSVILILASINQVRYELMVLTFILIIIVTGFSIFGYILFGSHVVQYYGMTNSFFSVISMFVGRLYYIEELNYSQNTEFVRLFVGSYSLIVGIYFVSTYLALVVYGYQQTHLAQDDGGILHQQFIDDLVYSLYINILMFFRLFTLVNSYRAKDESHRSKADYDAFVTMLKRYGWNVKEIKLFLKSFGVRRGVPLDFEELTKIYSDFWLRNQLFVEVEAHSEIREQLNRISKNLEWCELSILDIMSKTDVIADRAMKRSHISQ